MGVPVPVMPADRPLVFALNGQRVELPSVDPATTLLNYIRTESTFKGTKRGCGEGGCGACVVAISKYDTKTKEVKESTINSCLVLLCSIDGCAITTTEGLGSQRDGLHSIHKRLSAFHGSQCGFCTPGMTMAIYGCLKHEQRKTPKNGATTANGTPEARSPGPTSEKLERALQGNICRCTGYRPILDVCKSFASDVDLEDLGLNTCWAERSQAKQENLPPYDPAEDPKFPQFLIEELESRKKKSGTANSTGEVVAARFTHVERSRGMGDEERVWVSATTLAEVGHALQGFNGTGQLVKVIVGNTSSGIYKDIRPQVYVDISQIPELLAVRRDAYGLEIGAAIRISEFMELLVEESGCKDPVAKGLADHLQKLAGAHVRNWGSVGGNLVMAQQFGFESDLATILLGAGASVKVVTVGPHPSVLKLSIEEFLAKGSLGKGNLLQSIYIPLEHVEAATNNGHSPQNGGKRVGFKTEFKTFRASSRPFGNAVSFGNAAFLAHVSKAGKGTVIESAQLAFGAFGGKHAIRSLRVEEHLKGKPLSPSLLLECIELLKKDIVPLEGTSKRDYRISLAVGFLFEFLNPFLTGEPAATPISLSTHIGKQLIKVTDEHYPVNQPLPKFLSQLQASGEAVYTDDIPSPPRCLYAALVLSSEPLAKIKGYDTGAALSSMGAVDFISARDIPEGGKNVGLINPFCNSQEPLFVEELTGYVGEPLGVMVADTYDNAKMAAGKVKVEYDTHNVGTPIMTIEDAITQNSFYTEVAPAGPPVGDIETSLTEAELRLEGEVSTPSQYHFYMETQTTLAVPDEDGCMTIYTACQAPDWIQLCVAAALGLPLNNVRVITRRLGGSFGGKAFRNQQICVAVALAAYKLRQPVRISLDRNTDMQFIGGRSPTKTKFTVGFTKTGKITALRVDIIVEAGWRPDVSPIIAGAMVSSIKKYNFGSFDASIKVCKTNNVPKTSVRAPGDVQGSAMADNIIDQVASYLGIRSDKVRDASLHTAESITAYYGASTVGDITGFTLDKIWHQLKTSSRKEERENEVEKFNAQNKWLKRGLAMVTSVYGVYTVGNTATVSIYQDGSIVVEVGGVEMGQGLYTKVRQAVAYCLSSLCTKEESMALVSKIRLLQNDTFSLPNQFCDGGSTTSEGTCAAVEVACANLVKRLSPIKEQLVKAQPDGNVTWENLCLMAKMMQIDMQSHERWSPPMSRYLLYGAGVSEVEINILTGETRILAADLLYDCGKSLNPAVDLGQVEGAYVQGIGFFLTEEIVRDAKGKLLSDGTWTYKPPTIDTIPQQLNVELFKSPVHKDRVFSSKASGEPPLLLAGSVHSAIRNAIDAARKDYLGGNASHDLYKFNPPATIDKVKALCGLDNVEHHLYSTIKKSTISGV